MMRWEMINVSWIYHLQKPPIEYFINSTEYFNKRAVGENHYADFCIVLNGLGLTPLPPLTANVR